MDADQAARIYAEVVRGVPVEQSRHVHTAADRAFRETVEAEVAQIRAAEPNVFEIPNEVPGCGG